MILKNPNLLINKWLRYYLVETKGVKSNYFGKDLYKIKNPQP